MKKYYVMIAIAVISALYSFYLAWTDFNELTALLKLNSVAVAFLLIGFALDEIKKERWTTN